MRVLALDGDVNTCVVAVRSLAKAGHKVIVGAPQKSSKAGWSRFCSGTFIYPAPQLDADGFVRAVAAEVAREPGTMVLPMTEPSTLALSAYREQIFAAGGRMVLPPHDVLMRGHDKHYTTALAKSLGIKVPESRLISDMDEAVAAASILPYPVVLKPRTSEEIAADGSMPLTGRPMYANSPGEFLESYEELSKASRFVIVQEFIEGQGAGYFALMHQGELRAECAHLRLREVHPTGSGSSLRVSVTPSPAVRDASLAMLRALKFHGAGMVEFRVRPDGVPVFLEVNPRLWNSLALAIYAGVDFPALLARMAESGDVEPQAGFRSGVRCRWIVGDCRHLVAVFQGKPPRYPGKFPGRWRSLWEFLKPVPGTHHDPFLLSDPLPELFDWLHSARRYWTRLTQPAPAMPSRPAEREKVARAK